MKKILATLVLAVATLSANAALFINNNTSCDAVLVLRAHDVNNASSCAYYSTRFTIPANSSMAFNNVTDVNAPAGPGWYPSFGGGTATLVTAGSGWDGVLVYYSSATFEVGNSSFCSGPAGWSGSVPGCSIASATWLPVGGANVLLELN